MSFDSCTPLAGPELIDPDRYAVDGYPFETWDRLRREAPVLRYQGPDYPFWALTRHQDIVETSRQPEIFSNKPRFQIMIGADYGSKESVVGWQHVESWGGRVTLIDLVQDRSTTRIVNRAA